MRAFSTGVKLQLYKPFMAAMKQHSNAEEEETPPPSGIQLKNRASKPVVNAKPLSFKIVIMPLR